MTDKEQWLKALDDNFYTMLNKAKELTALVNNLPEGDQEELLAIYLLKAKKYQNEVDKL